MNIYFVGFPSLAKGLDDFNFLAEELKGDNFYWYTFLVDSETRHRYSKINFITGLASDKLTKHILNMKMDLFVCPSHFEGFNSPIAEAILLQKPVIAYDLPELKITYGSLIEYVRSFEKKNLLSKILDFQKGVYRPNLRVAKRYVLDHFSPPAVCDRYLQVFEKSLKIRNDK